MRPEALHQFGPGGAKGRAVLVRNQVVDRQQLPLRLEPAQHRLEVSLPLVRVNGAKERMLEEPVKLPGRLAAQKVGAVKVGSSRVDLQACKLEYSIVSPK